MEYRTPTKEEIESFEMPMPDEVEKMSLEEYNWAIFLGALQNSGYKTEEDIQRVVKVMEEYVGDSPAKPEHRNLGAEIWNVYMMA